MELFKDYDSARAFRDKLKGSTIKINYFGNDITVKVHDVKVEGIGMGYEVTFWFWFYDSEKDHEFREFIGYCDFAEHITLEV